MSRLLDDLDPIFRPKAYELLARIAEANIPVRIVCTRRTAEEQAAALASGHSAVVHSRHQDGRAIDLVPLAVYVEATGGTKLDWDTSHPQWAQLGTIGERLGLTWGGRWKTPHDPGHFELS